MRTTVVAAALAAFVTAGSGGCGPKSQIDPHASVTLNGTLQAQSGAASAATEVKLIRHPDALQAIGELFVAVGSVGLACLSGRLDICSSFEDSTTGADGGYTFAMRGADTQGSVGTGPDVHHLRRLPGRKLCSCIRLHRPEDGADDSAVALLDRRRRARR